jgi:hypothetical protein
LDSGGNIPGNGEVWIASTAKFVLAPSNDTDPPASPYWSRDNLPGVNDPSQVQSEWIPSGLTPTFVSGSSFIFSGDQTGTFTPGRRLKTLNTAGTFYSTIGTSAFSASTTIGIQSDTIGVDSGLSAVSYGLINPKNTSLPLIVSVLNFGAKGDGVTDDTAAITAAVAAIQISGATLVFPSGTYLYSTSPNFAAAGASYLALGTVILQHTGSGNAVLFDGGAVSNLTVNCRFEGDFRINGNANSTNGLYIRSVHHSFFQFRTMNCATTGAGMRVDFSVCNTYFMPRVSSNEGVAFTSKPLYGMLLSQRGAGEGVDYCTFIGTIMEGVPTGIKCDVADGNVFLGGTAEGCSVRGIEETSNCHGNHFINMDLEQNTTDDANCAGVGTTFDGTDSNKLISLTGSSQVIRGGRHQSITTNGTANIFEDLRYNRNTGGTFTDSSLSFTAKRSVFNSAGTIDADQAIGTFTNDSAPAGIVGEYSTATVASTAAIALTTATTATVTSMSLTAGDWDVTGVVDFMFAAGTNYTNLKYGIGTSAAFTGQDTFGDYETAGTIPTNARDMAWSIPTSRISASTTITAFLLAEAVFTASTTKAYGTIRARRMR